MSEVGYYFTVDGLRGLLDALAARLADGGTLLSVHWTGTSEDHLLAGAFVEAQVRAHRAWRTTVRHTDEHFVLGVHVRGAVVTGGRGGRVGADVRPAIEGVVVVVPAHDEEHEIDGCLRSAVAALAIVGRPGALPRGGRRRRLDGRNGGRWRPRSSPTEAVPHDVVSLPGGNVGRARDCGFDLVGCVASARSASGPMRPGASRPTPTADRSRRGSPPTSRGPIVAPMRWRGSSRCATGTSATPEQPIAGNGS